MRLTACLLSGLLLFGCNGHGRGSEGKKPTNLDEALLYARLDYVDGGVSFDAYLGILDSLGRVNVDIGKRFLRDDEEFEHLLEKQVRRRDITVEQYRRYLEMKLGFLREYGRSAPDTNGAGQSGR
jgi:hypothetical protein